MKKFLFYSPAKLAALLVLKAIYAAGFVGFALVLQWAVNTIVAEGATIRQLAVCVGFMLGYVVLFLAVMLGKDRASTAYINKAVGQLRDNLTDKLLHARYQDFSREDSSKYLSNMTNDMKTIGVNYFSSMLSIPDEIFTFVFAVAAALYINVFVALAMLGLTLLIFVVPLIFNRPLNRANLQLSETVKRYTAELKQTFLGIDVVKNFGAQEKICAEIAGINKQLVKCNTKTDKLGAYSMDVGIFVVVILQIGSIAVSGYMLLTGALTIGAIIAVVQLGNNLFSPIMQVASKLTLIKGVGSLNETVLKLVDSPVETADGRFEMKQVLKVTDVVYKYPGEERPILQEVSAEFKKGRKYLIVGKSGSGKSTLLKLLAKMYEDYEGTIEVDGSEYHEISENSLYEKVAIAQQKSYLFDRSIRDNIDFNGSGDDDRLTFAVKCAELQEFVAAQPRGLDEVVNEEVNQISGGEKLRIGLARALYKKADILLLDEVTSALDKKTAHRVESNILSLEGLTVLNVSHKIHEDLLERYDRVLIIENGRITAAGEAAAIAANPIFQAYMASANQDLSSTEESV